MNDKKLALYEFLIRASLVLIFVLALGVGTFGLVAISQMLVRETLAKSRFLNPESTIAETR